MSHRIRALLVAAAMSLVVVPAAHAAAKPRKQFYLSLGDSYAVGYQGAGLRDHREADRWDAASSATVTSRPPAAFG